MVNYDTLLFGIFSFFTLLSAFMVIILSNAVHSVLFLILVFCNITFLLLLLGAEFFAFLLIIVYVGAIAVLFLFVIMMLNIKIKKEKFNFYYLIPIGIILFFFLNDFFFDLSKKLDLLNGYDYKLNWVSWIEESSNKSNTVVIGEVLYTYFGLLFLISGLILLVAMIGVIVLTMHQRSNLKKQKIEIQLITNPKKSLCFFELRKL